MCPKRTNAVTRAMAAGLLLLLLPVTPGPAAIAGAGGALDAFRGLGAWVDIFDDGAWNDPAGTVASLRVHGVRTLYLETCNFECNAALHRTTEMGAFVDAAHAQGMAVIAWYLPGFDDLGRDLERSAAAIDFRSPTGGAFDGFALDVEARTVQPTDKRNKRVLRLSRQIRDHSGQAYPLGAITPPHFFDWDPFPYSGLARQFDAFLPMAYHSSRAHGGAAIRRETIRDILAIRQGTGRPRIPIHVIGGIANKLNGAEVRGMAHAVREYGVLGASLYDAVTSTAEDWKQVAQVPANPPQHPALPLGLPSRREVGNLPRGDRSHPKEVWFHVGGLGGGARIAFQGFDVDAHEVTLFLNWRKVRDLPTSRGWGKTKRIELPGRLVRKGENAIGFVAEGSFPDWTRWGIRRVRLV